MNCSMVDTNEQGKAEKRSREAQSRWRRPGSSISVGGVRRAKVLPVLEREGPLRQASLAKSLRLAPRSVTQSIEGLERSGLVERRPDPDDQRCKLVLLTPKGRATLTTGMEAGQSVLRSIFGALEPDRQADLDILLNDIEAAQTKISRRLRR